MEKRSTTENPLAFRFSPFLFQVVHYPWQRVPSAPNDCQELHHECDKDEHVSEARGGLAGPVMHFLDPSSEVDKHADGDGYDAKTAQHALPLLIYEACSDEHDRQDYPDVCEDLLDPHQELQVLQPVPRALEDSGALALAVVKIVVDPMVGHGVLRVVPG